jgi:hypothetical protein
VGALLSTDRWQVAESQGIKWREWGDEFVVYIASRSETHLLGAEAGSILLLLLNSRQALSLNTMYAIANDNGEASASLKGSMMSAMERESLQTIVTEFERLGILTKSAA